MYRNTRPAWTAPADQWSRDHAADMLAQGYSAGAIIAKLEAYGTGFYAAQAIVRALQEGR
jgi:hypothetical protein